MVVVFSGLSHLAPIFRPAPSLLRASFRAGIVSYRWCEGDQLTGAAMSTPGICNFYTHLHHQYVFLVGFLFIYMSVWSADGPITRRTGKPASRGARSVVMACKQPRKGLRVIHFWHKCLLNKHL